MIAAILFKIQKAIEIQDKLIEKAKELKKATMEYLFAHGLHGEKTKQTEIGEIPKSWKIRQIKEVIFKSEQINPLAMQADKFEYIDVSSISRELLMIEATTTTLRTNAPGRARKLVKKGDVIIATVRPTLKRLAFIENQYDNQICSTAFCVLRSNTDFIHNRFLFYSMQQPNVFQKLEALQRGASYPAVTDKNIHSLFIPLPNKREQEEIIQILFLLDQKTKLYNKRKENLSNIFNSMLSRLMTGHIRINNFDSLRYLEGKI